MRYYHAERRPLLPAAVATVLSITITSWIAYNLFEHTRPLLISDSNGNIRHLSLSQKSGFLFKAVYECFMQPNLIWLITHLAKARDHFTYLVSFEILPGGAYSLFVTRIETLVLIASASGLIAFLVTYFQTQKCDCRKHVKGRMLQLRLTSFQFLVWLWMLVRVYFINGKTSGLELAPGITIASERETHHVLLTGATGSGKSIIIQSLLNQIIQRGEPVVIHDTKGDFTATLPSDQFLLLAPHDKRSAVWDIASDVRTDQDAREFAAMLIPESQHDPVWPQGAREILAGLIVCLQSTLKTDWGWQHLAEIVFQNDLKVMKNHLLRYYKNAAGYIEFEAGSTPSRMTISFIVTLRAHAAATILPLSAAWPAESKAPRFSAIKWLSHPEPNQRVVILQRAPHLATLSSGWIGALVQNFANIAVGPLLPDDPYRRLWFALDELPQLGKLTKFQQLLEAGRSRGICLILGIQDHLQLKAIYGSDIADSWPSMIGTKILCRMEAGNTAERIGKDWIGQRKVSWIPKNKTYAPQKPGFWFFDTTYSYQEQSEVIDVVSSDILGSGLGRRRSWPIDRIYALIIDSSINVRLGSWPLVPWQWRRPSLIEASWNQPNANADHQAN